MIRNNINGVKSLSSCLKILLWILSTLDSDMFNNSMKAEIKKTRHGFSCSVIVKNVRLKIIGMNIFINREAPKIMEKVSQRAVVMEILTIDF